MKSPKHLEIHVLCWIVYIFYEVVVTGLFTGDLADFWEYLITYIVHITFFYIHANILLPFVFSDSSHVVWKLPLAIICELVIYIFIYAVLHLTVRYLLQIEGLTIVNINETHKEYFVGVLYRAILFLLFSTGYYFFITTIKKNREEAIREIQLEQLKTDLHHITNDVLNKITTNRTNLVLTFSRNKVEKYSFIFEGGPIYYSDASSLQNLSASEGWGVDAFFGGTLYLPGNLEFKSENRYEYSEATQVFDQDFERLIMNLHLSKNFLKSEAITLRISANDLLDQNVGFRRTTHSAGFTQTDYTTISRHFMLSLIWDFNTMGEKGN